MNTLKYTLIGDGSSDKALMSIIKWLLDDLYPKLPNSGVFADFRRLTNPPKKGDIANQIKCASDYYQYDILFYHRDAERNDDNIIEERKKEIASKMDKQNFAKVVCVIPVVMMESWLLFDEIAIKKAAGNRNYKGKLSLPQINKLESIKNSKELLHNLLIDASGKKRSNGKGVNVNYAVHLVAENIYNYNPLRSLQSFKIFEQDLKTAVDTFIF